MQLKPETSAALPFNDDALIRAMFTQGGVPALITDAAGRILTINRAAALLLEIDPDEATQFNIAQWIEQSQRYQHDSIRKASLFDRMPRAFETQLQHAQWAKPFKYVHTTLSCLLDDHGELRGIGYQFLDLTMRVDAMELMQQDRDLLDSLLEAASDAILLVDQSGDVRVVNLQFETFFNVPRLQLFNQPLARVLPALQQREDLPEVFTRLLWRLASDPDFYDVTGGNFILQVPEHRDIYWYSQMVSGADGAPLGRMLVLRDNTREREAERAKTEFISLVSHELRTPLTSIRGFAEMLVDEDLGQYSPNVTQYLEIITQNSDRLMALVNDILDVTRLETGRIVLNKTTAEVEKVLISVAQSIQPQLEAHHQQLGVEIAPNLPSILIDRTRIAQVVSNLLSNAIKYSPEHTRVTLRASLIHKFEELPDSAPHELILPAVMISVEDQGIGIVPGDFVRIFSRFYRTESATRLQVPGSGLGLTIVKSFVEMHGGRIWLTSSADSGSVFYFTLPV